MTSWAVREQGCLGQLVDCVCASRGLRLYSSLLCERYTRLLFGRKHQRPDDQGQDFGRRKSSRVLRMMLLGLVGPPGLLSVNTWQKPDEQESIRGLSEEGL